MSEWKYATELIRALGLPRHPDPPRNWDTLGALRLILRETSKEDRVLDVAPDARSSLVEWLYLLGYRRLEVLNPSFARTFQRGPIQYRPGELSNSLHRTESFSAVASLDVGDRWETLERQLPEIWRILRPDGVLVLSTRYWEGSANGNGRNPTGEEPRILTRPEIHAFLGTAREQGFEATGPVDLDVREHALRPPYGCFSSTLLKLALRKQTLSRA